MAIDLRKKHDNVAKKSIDLGKIADNALNMLEIGACVGDTLEEPKMETVTLPARPATEQRVVTKRKKQAMRGRDVVRMADKVFIEGNECDRIILTAYSLKNVNEQYGFLSWLRILLEIVAILEDFFVELADILTFSEVIKWLEEIDDALFIAFGDGIILTSIRVLIKNITDVLEDVNFYTRSLKDTAAIYTTIRIALEKLIRLVE